MNRLSRIVAGLALLGLLVSVSNSMSADEKTPTTKEIMQKAHKKDVGLVFKIGADLKADKPDWDAIAKESKELVGLADALGKNKPSKGEMDSWTKLSTQYDDNAKALLAAAEKKELKDAKAAQGKLAMSCKECHMAHKGK